MIRFLFLAPLRKSHSLSNPKARTLLRGSQTASVWLGRTQAVHWVKAPSCLSLASQPGCCQTYLSDELQSSQMSCLWLHCGRVPGLSLHCLQASSLSSWHRAIPGMFLVLSVTRRDGDLPTGLGRAGQAAGDKDASNLTMKRGTSLGKYVLTHEPQSRGESRDTMGFPQVSTHAEITQQHRVSGWLSSTPARCYHKPDRDLVLCPLSSKHVQLGQFLIAFTFYGCQGSEHEMTEQKAMFLQACLP